MEEELVRKDKLDVIKKVSYVQLGGVAVIQSQRPLLRQRGSQIVCVEMCIPNTSVQ